MKSEGAGSAADLHTAGRRWLLPRNQRPDTGRGRIRAVDRQSQRTAIAALPGPARAAASRPAPLCANGRCATFRPSTGGACTSNVARCSNRSSATSQRTASAKTGFVPRRALVNRHTYWPNSNPTEDCELQITSNKGIERSRHTSFENEKRPQRLLPVDGSNGSNHGYCTSTGLVSKVISSPRPHHSTLHLATDKVIW